MLRQFAGLWLFFFGALACWHGFHLGQVGVGLALGLLATVVGVVGMVWPQAIRPIFVGWMVAAFPIGWLVSHVTLAMLFYGLFTPVGWVFRWMGRDALRLRPQPSLESYWQPKPAATDVRQYFHQF
jgi:hypothetical protein